MKWENDLIKDIRFYDNRDDEDYASFTPFKERLVIPNPYEEFTAANHAILESVFKFSKINTALEIGVCRNAERSSTYTIINNLPKNGIYLGVDLEDKSFLNSDNIHTIQTNSSNYDIVVEKLKDIGIDKLDFIHIDGWHSINQVLKDWEYTKLLNVGGVVCLHDTNAHPGPYLLTENLNNKWYVVKTCPNDFGFTFCKKLCL